MTASRAPAADELLVGFARVLRAAGMAVTPDRTSAFVEAVALTGFNDRAATYWSGRATLCSSLDDVELYDNAFTAWFTPLPEESKPAMRVPAARQPQASLEPESGAGDVSGDDLVAARASTAEVLRHRDVGTLTEQDRAQLAMLFDTLEVVAPLRRALRQRPHHRGSVDLRRTLRAQLRSGGELARLSRRRSGVRRRRIVMLIDISGSMQPYADSLLRLAHRIVRAMPNQVEVFTIGTRLTRISPALRVRQADEALAAAGRLVPDWSGGTRLGEVIGAFLSRWGRRGLARGAVVVIASDGWERGDAELLGEQIRQLQLLAYAVIWMNPHRGKAGYAPIQTGIQACLPHLDRMVAGHSLVTFAELLEVIADA
ncbi:MAG TPA: VWA domain-containing protein [Propionibacteriaceae bacterium]|nr:VWA domain-containing protein [Propionibacteriaceae bacterium]